VKGARLLVELLPEPECLGLLARMLINESRRTARAYKHGDVILLEDQDRSLWDQKLIQEGIALVEKVLTHLLPAQNSVPNESSFRWAEPCSVQAAIAAVHSEAKKADETDWAQIVALYDVLLQMEFSPVVELDRAVAVAMKDGPAVALTLIKRINKNSWPIISGSIPPRRICTGGWAGWPRRERAIKSH
jgi:RNA polymerase sigma-70 factor, ECF subfamily